MQILEQYIITSHITGKLLADLNEGDSLGCISNVLWNSSTVIMQLQNNESTVHLSGWWNELLRLASHYIHLAGKVYCKVKEAGEEEEGNWKDPPFLPRAAPFLLPFAASLLGKSA